jgi:hypothetical protein
MVQFISGDKFCVGRFNTIRTASRATRAKTSEQETTPGQFFSSADFTASMTLNPLKVLVGIASFSA